MLQPIGDNRNHRQLEEEKPPSSRPRHSSPPLHTKEERNAWATSNAKIFNLQLKKDQEETVSEPGFRQEKPPPEAKIPGRSLLLGTLKMACTGIPHPPQRQPPPLHRRPGRLRHERHTRPSTSSRVVALDPGIRSFRPGTPRRHRPHRQGRLRQDPTPPDQQDRQGPNAQTPKHAESRQ